MKKLFFIIGIVVLAGCSRTKKPEVGKVTGITLWDDKGKKIFYYSKVGSLKIEIQGAQVDMSLKD